MAAPIVRKMWVGTLFVLALAVLWFTGRIILLLFASLLIALILTSLTNLLRRLIPLGRKTGLAGVLLILCGAVVGLSLLAGPAVLDKTADLYEILPELFEEASDKLRGVLPVLEKAAPDGPGGVSKIFSSTFEAGSSFVFIVFSSLFLAATPDLYRRMLIRLFPPRLRDDINQTVQRIIQTLKSWLFGQFISMAVVGIMTGVALALIGIPFSLLLGLLAGLGEFIPFIGPLLVSIPALLLALSEGTDKFLIVIGVLLVIQLVEGNVIMPIVQRQAVQLPPVITLTSMIMLGGAFGLLGLFVAAPLVAMILVLIEEWYLKRYLGTDDKLLE
jgi:predicted PurR-regulated permease PerM